MKKMIRRILDARVSPFVPIVAAAAIFCGCGSSSSTGAESVARLAGAAGGPGYFDGTGGTVRFSSPSGVAVVGTQVYVADTSNHVVRRIDTETGAVSTLAGIFGSAGSSDGTGSEARFDSPTGIVAAGTILFVCDTGNHTVRKIVSGSGTVTTVAGTAGTAGSNDNLAGGTNVLFSSPRGIAADAPGTTLYVADTGNHKIRKVSAATGATTTYAGSGASGASDNTGTSAGFSSPEGVASVGNDLYVADTGNHTIRKIVPAGAVGSVTTFAGTSSVPGFADNTTGALARFFSPSSLAAIGTDLYVADTGNNVLRKLDATSFTTTLAGDPLTAGSADGTGAAAGFRASRGIASDGASLFVADTQNHTVRKVTVGGSVSTVGGTPPSAGVLDGTGTSARFNAPAGIAFSGDNVFVADTGNHTIRKATSSGTVATLAGGPGTPGLADGTGSAARFRNPRGIAVSGGDLYVADPGNNAIRKIAVATGAVTTFAGSASGVPGFSDGTGTAATFNAPKGIATDGSSLFVADTGNHAVRKIVIATGAVTTLAGTGAAGFSDNPTGTSAAFNGPEGVAVIGSFVYVADTGNHAVRKVSNPSGATVTFAGADPPGAAAGFADGSGGSARFSSPGGIAAAGSVLYLADTGNHCVRRISTAATVTTFVGAPEAATDRDGEASQALLNAPVGIAGLSSGTLYFTDVNENVVRRITF
jgi:sugar lactone lactonase YvrE